MKDNNEFVKFHFQFSIFNFHLRKRSAFALIELLVAIAIIVMLSGISIVGYNRFHDRQAVSRAAADLASDLRLTQQKAISGEKPSGWCTLSGQTLTGWQLVFPASSTSYTIQGLCSTGSTTNSKTVTLSAVTRVPTTAVTILFDSLSGSTLTAQSMTLTGTAIGATAYSKIVTVTTSGAIEIQ